MCGIRAPRTQSLLVPRQKIRNRKTDETWDNKNEEQWETPNSLKGILLDPLGGLSQPIHGELIRLDTVEIQYLSSHNDV